MRGLAGVSSEKAGTKSAVEKSRSVKMASAKTMLRSEKGWSWGGGLVTGLGRDNRWGKTI